MSKIFLSYRFTGEDPKEIEGMLASIKHSLESAGHEVFCTFWLGEFFKQSNFTTEQIYEYSLKKVDECDVFLAFVKSVDPSKGMQMESEKAVKQDKRYVLAIKEGLKFPEFRTAAHQTIEYQSLEQLYSELKGVK